MYKNNLSFRSMHKIRCALRITRKYRRTIKPPHEGHRENENPLIAEAISIFRSHIKASPTYVCTVCHKASFPNQVTPCKRSSYVKNPKVVATCLTGNYVMFVILNAETNSALSRIRENQSGFASPVITNGVMPTLAVANNMQLAKIPPELLNLNILERHLVAKCITFAKIIPLPKGRQRAITWQRCLCSI